MYAQLILSVKQVNQFLRYSDQTIDNCSFIPVEPAGDRCYGSSTKPCKSEGCRKAAQAECSVTRQ